MPCQDVRLDRPLKKDMRRKVRVEAFRRMSLFSERIILLESVI